MKKICNRDFIIKLTIIFLIIQPILDIKALYDFEIIGVTIPTIIRLAFFAILFLLFVFDKKKLKLPIFYFILIGIYTVCHLINVNQNYINSLGKFSLVSEIIYLVRLAIPMLFIMFSYNYKIEFKKISKLFFMISFIFSSVMIVTNIIGIAYPSYSQTKEIIGSFLNWMFLDKNKIGYFNLSTKGLFGYANPLAGLLCLILPILLASFYKKSNIKKFLLIYAILISMLILGTRISSYMSVIILIVMLIIYIGLCGLFKTEKFNLKCFLYNLALIVLIIPFFLFSPITFLSDRGMSEEQSNYALENDLLEKVVDYKKEVNSDLTEEKEAEIKDFITKNSQYFSINEGLAPDKYLYEDYLSFWLDYFIVSYNNLNNTRDFEHYLYKHIYEHNNNVYDSFVGYGYSQIFNDGVVLERDGIYHFYTLGIFGLLLFIIPYYIILIYAIIKVLNDIKNKMNLENITYIFIVALLLVLAIIGGNLFDFFLVNIFLSFICGQLLYNVRSKKIESCKDSLDNIEINNDTATVSVIVPVYNVENYIEKCLDSLVNQTLKNIEIIIIDDGSTDDTGKIIDKYQKEYTQLKVIHKKNGGVSLARNLGLKQASGEYIGFLDSDDWVNTDMYEKMYIKAKQLDADIVSCDTLAIYPDNQVLIKSNINENNPSKNLLIDAYAVIWNKIYRRDLISGIKFKPKMNFCEDVRFLYMIYPKIKKIGVIDEALHNYLQRPGSLTYTYNKKLYQLIESMDDIIDYYKKNGYYDLYKEELEYTYVRYLFATFIKRLAKTKNKEEFNKGINVVLDKVKKRFPNYRKNKYIRKFNGKSLYLKYFNKRLANIIFKLEKNRLN